jgi:hypothetical protein
LSGKVGYRHRLAVDRGSLKVLDGEYTVDLPAVLLHDVLSRVVASAQPQLRRVAVRGNSDVVIVQVVHHVREPVGQIVGQCGTVDAHYYSLASGVLDFDRCRRSIRQLLPAQDVSGVERLAGFIDRVVGVLRPEPIVVTHCDGGVVVAESSADPRQPGWFAAGDPAFLVWVTRCR